MFKGFFEGLDIWEIIACRQSEGEFEEYSDSESSSSTFTPDFDDDDYFDEYTHTKLTNAAKSVRDDSSFANGSHRSLRRIPTALSHPQNYSVPADSESHYVHVNYSGNPAHQDKEHNRSHVFKLCESDETRQGRLLAGAALATAINDLRVDGTPLVMYSESFRKYYLRHVEDEKEFEEADKAAPVCHIQSRSRQAWRCCMNELEELIVECSTAETFFNGVDFGMDCFDATKNLNLAPNRSESRHSISIMNLNDLNIYPSDESQSSDEEEGGDVEDPTGIKEWEGDASAEEVIKRDPKMRDHSMKMLEKNLEALEQELEMTKSRAEAMGSSRPPEFSETESKLESGLSWVNDIAMSIANIVARNTNPASEQRLGLPTTGTEAHLTNLEQHIIFRVKIRMQMSELEKMLARKETEAAESRLRLSEMKADC